MKILLSPAKTLDISKASEGANPFFNKESEEVLAILKSLSKDELARAMKIKTKILDSTYDNILNFESLETGRAIEAYSGMVFKNLDFTSLKNKKYIEENLIILDAFYGLLRAYDLIRPYRMDFKCNIEGLNLYDFWSKKINEFLAEFAGDKPIVSLASKEYLKLIKIPVIEIEFRVLKDGKYKNVATFAKMARGKCLRAMAENEVESLAGLRELCFDKYSYNEELSGGKSIFFTKVL